MTEPPPPDPLRLPLRWAVLATVVVGGLLDLFCLLLLPFRLAGHLVPVAPVLVLAVNVVLAGWLNRLAADRIPAQVLLGVTILLAAVGVLRGPGGDLLVTRDLEGMYLLFVITALVGAGIPLFRRTRP